MRFCERIRRFWARASCYVQQQKQERREKRREKRERKRQRQVDRREEGPPPEEDLLEAEEEYRHEQQRRIERPEEYLNYLAAQDECRQEQRRRERPEECLEFLAAEENCRQEQQSRQERPDEDPEFLTAEEECRREQQRQRDLPRKKFWNIWSRKRIVDKNNKVDGKHAKSVKNWSVEGSNKVDNEDRRQPPPLEVYCPDQNQPYPEERPGEAEQRRKEEVRRPESAELESESNRSNSESCNEDKDVIIDPRDFPKRQEVLDLLNSLDDVEAEAETLPKLNDSTLKTESGFGSDEETSESSTTEVLSRIPATNLQYECGKFSLHKYDPPADFETSSSTNPLRLREVLQNCKEGSLDDPSEYTMTDSRVVDPDSECSSSSYNPADEKWLLRPGSPDSGVQKYRTREHRRDKKKRTQLWAEEAKGRRLLRVARSKVKNLFKELPFAKGLPEEPETPDESEAELVSETSGSGLGESVTHLMTLPLQTVSVGTNTMISQALLPPEERVEKKRDISKLLFSRPGGKKRTPGTSQSPEKGHIISNPTPQELSISSPPPSPIKTPASNPSPMEIAVPASSPRKGFWKKMKNKFRPTTHILPVNDSEHSESTESDKN